VIAQVSSSTESHALTLALSRFAGEGTRSSKHHNAVPSTAKRERVRVRVRIVALGDADAYRFKFCSIETAICIPSLQLR
jgi:hypothetical protein